MARFNEILVGRYNRMVQKLLSMKGAASLVTLADEAIVVVPLFYGAENRYLEGWDRFGFLVSVAAVAASLAGCRLRNPVGSNVVAVLEKIAFFSTTAADQPVLTQGTATADLAVVSAPALSRFDARARPNSTCIVSSASPAGALTNATIKDQLTLAASVRGDFIITDIQEIPLAPGDAYQITSNNANQNGFFTWWWRERFLEDSERA